MSSTNFVLVLGACVLAVVHLAVCSRIAARIASLFRRARSSAPRLLEDSFAEAVLSSRSPHSLRLS
jgi:hypothetical protein